MSADFDLIIFGQITQDVLHATGQNFQRVGGVAYAASTAARLGARVGLLASVPGSSPEIVCNEIRRRGIDVQGVRTGNVSALTYKVDGADEIKDTTVMRSGPSPQDMLFPENLPDDYQRAQWALVYPVWMPSALAAARQLQATGTCIAADFQHDVESLADAHELLKLCDYVFLNAESLQFLTSAGTIANAIGRLRQVTDATIVVKMGIGGSLVWPTRGPLIEIPAFLSDFQLTVGAGDAFDAAFLHTIMQGGDLRAAGLTAARVAATVIESISSDPSASLVDGAHTYGRQSVFLTPEKAKSLQVYIAGHFHSAPLRTVIEDIAAAVARLGMRAFVPHRDVGIVGTNGLTSEQAYCADLDGLRQSQAVIALLDGAGRGGTFVEIGVAIEKDIPIIALCTDRTMPLSNMVVGACSDIVSTVRGVVNPLMQRLAAYEGNI